MPRPRFDNGFHANGTGCVIYVRYTAELINDEGEPFLHVTDHDEGLDWDENMDGWEFIKWEDDTRIADHWKHRSGKYYFDRRF